MLDGSQEFWNRRPLYEQADNLIGYAVAAVGQNRAKTALLTTSACDCKSRPSDELIYGGLKELGFARSYK